MDNRIKQNLVYLGDNLINLNRVLLYLVQNDIISLNECDDIVKEDTSFNQNFKLLRVILRKDFQPSIFLEILRNTQNGRCADKIEGISPNAERKLDKPKLLRNLWWPDKRDLIKSLHRRKIGDKLLIEKLHERISRDENRMLAICESVDASKLTGLGGVGKTLTATWYANHYEAEYDHVIWISAGEDSLQKCFKALARDLKIEDRKELSEVEEFARKCYNTLEEFKCLWIFDNAESYRGYEGIGNVLPKRKTNFYCLITSRWREWGTKNVGHGQISRLELSIFGEEESLEFFKQNLKEDIKYTEYQLKELCRLLGNLPLAMQLAVAALNTGKIDLKNYIEKTSTKDLENIVDTKFDDYEKTINASVNITLELISKEEGGAFAKEVLNVFGYIRPDNIKKDFLTGIFYSDAHLMIPGMANKAIKLLKEYSLITQVVEADSYGILVTFLSIHRLLQQVVRHNGRNNEKETLRKILGCEGFLDYKLVPFTKYADDELRTEFPKVKAELLSQRQLRRLVKEKRFDESVQLVKYIDKELQKPATKFNYAICLEMNGQLEDNIEVLEELYKNEIKEDIKYRYDIAEMGLLKLEKEVSKSLVGGHLLISQLKLDNKERLQEILKKRNSFMMIPSQEMMNSLLRILSSNLINCNYSLTIQGWIFKLLLNGDTKGITLFDCIVDLCIPLPNDLQELFLQSVGFKQIKSKGIYTINLTEWLPMKLNVLKISYHKPHPIFLSLESVSSIDDITLLGCSLSLDSVKRISPRKLKLGNVSFVKNGQELSKVSVNEFIDFRKMKQLKLFGYAETILSLDLSAESANIEYIHLYYLNVSSLKSANGKVKIKEALIQYCLLDLSILPPSLEKLSVAINTKVFASGGIDLPNLKYLDLYIGISPLSHFHSLPMTHLYLNQVKEISVNILPPSVKVIRIHKCDSIRFLGGVICLDKLILHDFPLNEVEEMLTHFHIKQLVLKICFYQPDDISKFLEKQRLTTAIGKLEWSEDFFKNSILSKQVDRKSKYYIFKEGTGKAIEKKDFYELYSWNGSFHP